MSSGHNRHKGFSQTSKRYDSSLKQEHLKGRSKQHSSVTAKESEEEKSPSGSSGSVERKSRPA